MIEAYKKFWKGYVDFKGRSTRSDYWLAVLANTIVTIILFSTLIVKSSATPYQRKSL